MTENKMKFMALKGKLYLKLSKGEESFEDELNQIKEVLTDSPEYKSELENLIMRLVRQSTGQNTNSLLQVARETGCIPEDLIRLEQQVAALDGQTATVQKKGLREVLNQSFPEDVSLTNRAGFFSEILGMAIEINDPELITEVIHKIEELS